MLFAVLSLLAIALIMRLVFWLIRHLLTFINSGEKLPGATAREAEKHYLLSHKSKAAKRAFVMSMHMSWYQLVIIFTAGSVAGLILEQIWMFATAGLLELRVGLVWGPFSPLYGFGAVFMTLASYFLMRAHAKWWQIFLVCAAIGGALEQITGMGLELALHAQSWSYAHLPDHITTYVAWRFLIAWGALGLIWTNWIMPSILTHIDEPSYVRQAWFVALLALYLAADITMTVVCFGRAAARMRNIPPQNSFEQWVDHHYSDQFIASRFQNMVIGDAHDQIA